MGTFPEFRLVDVNLIESKLKEKYSKMSIMILLNPLLVKDINDFEFFYI